VTATFPQLSRKPSAQNFGETAAHDPTIRTDFGSGARLSRAEFTRVSKQWSVTYRCLTATDKVLLEALQAEVKVGADSFYWTHPTEQTTYEVRLTAPIVWRMEPKRPGSWQATFTLEERIA